MSCINRQRLAECNEKGEGESAKMQRRWSDSSILLFRRRVFALWPLHFRAFAFATSHSRIVTLKARVEVARSEHYRFGQFPRTC